MLLLLNKDYCWIDLGAVTLVLPKPNAHFWDFLSFRLRKTLTAETVSFVVVAPGVHFSCFKNHCFYSTFAIATSKNHCFSNGFGEASFKNPCFYNGFWIGRHGGALGEDRCETWISLNDIQKLWFCNDSRTLCFEKHRFSYGCHIFRIWTAWWKVGFGAWAHFPQSGAPPNPYWNITHSLYDICEFWASVPPGPFSPIWSPSKSLLKYHTFSLWHLLILGLSASWSISPNLGSLQSLWI